MILYSRLPEAAQNVHEIAPIYDILASFIAILSSLTGSNLVCFT